MACIVPITWALGSVTPNGNVNQKNKETKVHFSPHSLPAESLWCPLPGPQTELQTEQSVLVVHRLFLLSVPLEDPKESESSSSGCVMQSQSSSAIYATRLPSIKTEWANGLELILTEPLRSDMNDCHGCRRELSKERALFCWFCYLLLIVHISKPALWKLN